MSYIIWFQSWLYILEEYTNIEIDLIIDIYIAS